MNLYISIIPVKFPSESEMVARSQLMKEKQMFVKDEVWVKDRGTLPVWQCPSVLTKDEMEVLELEEY
jgi:hypothetical protein